MTTPVAAEKSPVPVNYLSEEAGCALLSTTPTDQLSAALQFIMLRNHDKSSAVAEDLHQRPRLTYNRKTLKLLVKVPSDIHEEMISIINSGLWNIDRDLRAHIPRKVLNSKSALNLLLSADTMEFVPDCAYFVITYSIPSIKHLTVLAEVAFSQTRDDLLGRLKTMVKAYPEVLLVIVAIIDESPRYHSPRRHSTASNILLKEESIRSEAEFLSSCPELQTLDSFDSPTDVVIAGHNWCSISHIHLQVWIRGTKPIDIDTNDPSLMAHGDLFPSDDSVGVMSMMQKGVLLLKEHYAIWSLLASPNSDLSALRAAEITQPFDCDDIKSRLTFASRSMAYSRYRRWYEAEKGRPLWIVPEF